MLLLVASFIDFAATSLTPRLPFFATPIHHVYAVAFTTTPMSPRRPPSFISISPPPPYVRLLHFLTPAHAYHIFAAFFRRAYDISGTTPHYGHVVTAPRLIAYTFIAAVVATPDDMLFYARRVSVYARATILPRLVAIRAMIATPPR